MRRPEFIARQSGQPSGILGKIIGWIMERETAAQNDAALAAFAINPGDCILEIGFGIASTLPTGRNGASAADVVTPPELTRCRSACAYAKAS